MKKVMVVDDSKPIRTQVGTFLESKGLIVLDAVNGDDAIKKIQEKPTIDLFIIDYNMPIINGIELCKLIRNTDEHRTTPVLMLTTEAAEELIEQARSLGVTAWILKPFDPVILEKAMKKIGLMA